MNSVLFGKGYWGSIVKEKITDLTNLLLVVDSKTDDKTIDENLICADIVFICSSTPSHYDIVKRCIYIGIKHIFCTKPFTGDYEKAKELYNIAKQRSVNIFVDNLFLFREEIINFQLSDFRNISFYWIKTRSKENILNSLLYHDLYLLLKWSKSDKWKFNEGKMYNDSFYLSMVNGSQSCSFDYSIDNERGGKWIYIDDHIVSLSYPQNDPLQECIINILQDNIDYDLSRKVTLDTLKLLSYIKNHESFLYASKIPD